MSRRATVFALLAVNAAALFAFQRFGRRGGEETYLPQNPSKEFHFGRAIYRSSGRWSWETDYPKADRQFMMGVQRLTRIESADGPVTIPWLDPRLFQYPWLYAVEVGYLVLDDQEAARIREYLARGGFLFVDDFHGAYEWARFANEIQKVFPDRRFQELDMSAHVFHVFFDIPEKIQIPVVRYIDTGITHERDGVHAYHGAIFDDRGRIVLMVNYNMDTGDGWEWADLPEYPERFSTQAYRLGINYIVYAMTH